MLIFLLASMLLVPAGFALGDEGESSSESEEEDEFDEEKEFEDEKDEDEDEDEREDEREDETKHEVKTEISDDEIKVELERETAEAESKIEFKTDLSEAKFKLEFEEETDQFENEQKLEVKLQSLIEFLDENANGAYDEGEEILSNYRIGDGDDGLGGVEETGAIEWDAPSLADINVDGNSGKKMEARGSFGPDGNATFGLDIMVFGDFTMLNGSQLMPTDVKIDFLILDYPYTSNDSLVGLMMKTKTKQEQERDHEDIDADEEGVVAASTTEANSVALAFTWKGSATVDGVDLPVMTTVLSSESETEQDEFEFKQRFVLSYARGDEIIHDPVAGVAYASNEVAGSSSTEETSVFDQVLPGFELLFAVGAISIAAIARGGRAHKD